MGRTRGNYENDILAILSFCASNGGDWKTVDEISDSTGMPKRRVTRILSMATNRMSASQGHWSYSDKSFTAWQSIAGHHGFESRIRTQPSDTPDGFGPGFRYEVAAVRRNLVEKRADKPLLVNLL